MKIVLLAGGVSKRLWPLNTDKNLWPFFPENLLTFHLNSLKEMGLSDIVVVANGKNSDAIKKTVKSIFPEGKIVIQEEALGMGQALLLAENEIKDSSILVLNCDDLVELSLLDEVRKVIDTGSDLILVGKKFDTYFDGGYFQLKDGKPVGLIEKPGEGKEPSNLIKLVVDYFKDSNSLLEKLKTIESSNDDLYEFAIDQLLKEKTSNLVSYNGLWKTIKYPWQILEIMDYFLSTVTESVIDPDTDISPRAVIEGPVIIKKGVKIFENAKVRGPAYLGEDVVIANNSLVRESYIGKGSVVGFSSEVARSYLGENCWTHSNFVGDSVLEKNISFGYGTVLTNLKLDESEIYSVVKGKKINTKKAKFGSIIGANVRIGSNVTVMPGVKIGADCFIGAGILLNEDLDAGQFLYAVQEQVKKPNLKVDSTSDRSEFKGKL